MNGKQRSFEGAGKILLLAASVASALIMAMVLPRSLEAQAPQTKFQGQLARAAEISTLAAPGGVPFHLKLTTSDMTMHNPEYTAEIEIWWAAPDRWRREIKSPSFRQTAIQDGTQYFESNSAEDYLPYWIQELATAAIDPIPIAALASVSPDEDQPGCANWETEHGAGVEKFSSYNSICFNYDGTAHEIFAPPIGVQLEAYGRFGDKEIARRLTVWPGSRSDATAVVSVLEPLPAKSLANVGYSDGHFAIPHDTDLASRVRFVSVPESALTAADLPARPPLTWPSSYTFPLSGIIAITVQIDRGGNVREFPSAISKNQAINAGAVAQIKNWKFKPYLVDGEPVEVVTTLSVPFHLKYEPLGASGKIFPEISLGQHIEGSHTLSDPRAPGSQPFFLHATITLVDGTAGQYSEMWQSPSDLRRTVSVAAGMITEVNAKGQSQTSEKFTGVTAPDLEMELAAVLVAMVNHFPDPRTFQEADWGNSAVEFSNIDPTASDQAGPPELIRAARGRVDAHNRPVSGQAYWFDSDGLLRADFVDTTSTVYSNFVPWNGKQIPRQIEVFKNAKLLLRINVDSISEQQSNAPSGDVAVRLLTYLIRGN
jgi:hypothetical protein